MGFDYQNVQNSMFVTLRLIYSVLFPKMINFKKSVFIQENVFNAISLITQDKRYKHIHYVHISMLTIHISVIRTLEELSNG